MPVHVVVSRAVHTVRVTQFRTGSREPASASVSPSEPVPGQLWPTGLNRPLSALGALCGLPCDPASDPVRRRSAEPPREPVRRGADPGWRRPFRRRSITLPDRFSTQCTNPHAGREWCQRPEWFGAEEGSDSRPPPPKGHGRCRQMSDQRSRMMLRRSPTLGGTPTRCSELTRRLHGSRGAAPVLMRSRSRSKSRCRRPRPVSCGSQQAPCSRDVRYAWSVNALRGHHSYREMTA